MRIERRSGVSGLAPQAILWEITPLSFKIRWENTIVGRSTMYIPLVILRLQHTYWMILWSWTCFRLSNPLVDYKQTLHIFCSPPQLSSISSHQICQGYWAQEKGKDANDWHQPVLPRSPNIDLLCLPLGHSENVARIVLECETIHRNHSTKLGRIPLPSIMYGQVVKKSTSDPQQTNAWHSYIPVYLHHGWSVLLFISWDIVI